MFPMTSTYILVTFVPSAVAFLLGAVGNFLSVTASVMIAKIGGANIDDDKTIKFSLRANEAHDVDNLVPGPHFDPRPIGVRAVRRVS